MRTTTASAGRRAATRTRSSRHGIYLSANPDVAAAGVNPLAHFDAIGWQEGRMPSLDFDPAQYLAANPDVAAAQCRSAAALSAVRRQEGRQPFAPTECSPRAASTTSSTCSTIRTSRRRASIRCSTSRPSAGMKGAIRTRCSTSPAIWRTTPTSRPQTSTRSTTTTVRLARRARPVGRVRHHVISCRLSGRASRGRQPADALPALRHPRGTFALRGRRVGVRPTKARTLRPRQSQL